MGNGFCQTNTGVKAPGDDVDQAGVTDDINAHLGIASSVLLEQRLQQQVGRAMRCIDAQGAAGFVEADAGLFSDTFDLRQFRSEALHIALSDVGEGNIARGAIEQAHLQAMK